MIDSPSDLAASEETTAEPVAQFRCANCGTIYDQPVTPCEQCGRSVLEETV